MKGALIAHRHTASSCISPLAIGLAVAVAISPRESAGGADRGTGLPHVISCSPDDLAAAKTSLASGDTRLMPALQQLLRDADQGLRQAAVSVLEKETSVDGAAPRDYVSFAPYWWPNPNSADGLPYIRKDGQHNRDRRALGDVGNFSAVKRSVSALALGYYFTDDTRYARHAADLLRAWFLDPKTGMNPNLNHAQAVPGVATGRPAGLIEFRDMPQLLDSLGLLERSPDWGEPDRKAMRAWLTSYCRFPDRNVRPAASGCSTTGADRPSRTERLVLVVLYVIHF